MTTAIAAKSGAGFLLAGAERTAGTFAETISRNGPTTGPTARRSPS